MTGSESYNPLLRHVHHYLHCNFLDAVYDDRSPNIIHLHNQQEPGYIMQMVDQVVRL